MPLLRRRGFTLIELMVALVLLGIVAGGIYKVLVTNQQTYMAQTQRIDLQQNLRAGVTILPADFRELDPADGDILLMTATQIQIRAMRQLSFLCIPPVLGGGLGTTVTMTVRADPYYGDRVFDTSDSVLVYYEGNPGTRNDDTWLPAELKTVTNPSACADGTPGYQLTVKPTWLGGTFNVPGAVTNGSPVRGYHVVTYQLYQASDGKWYVGQQDNSAGGTMQPLIGPVASNGLQFTYFDAAGAVTAVPTQVASIGITLIGQTAAPIRQANMPGIAYKTDTVTTRVAVRNNPRCGPCL